MVVGKISYQLQNSKTMKTQTTERTNKSKRESFIYSIFMINQLWCMCAYLLDLYAVWPMPFKSYSIFVYMSPDSDCVYMCYGNRIASISISEKCLHYLYISQFYTKKKLYIVSYIDVCLLIRNGILNSKYHYVTTN